MTVIPSSTAVPPEVQRTVERERNLSQLLSAWIASGIAFLLLPGTFLGVWNLLQISKQHSPLGIAPAWLQAHGQAQIFGWVGSFIMGIGLHAIPRLRRSQPFPLSRGWTCWALWNVSVFTHWWAGVNGWHWRVLLSLSAVGELVTFLLFAAAVSRHRDAQPRQEKTPPWIRAVLTGMIGFALALLLNCGGSILIALQAPTPAFPHVFDEILIVVMTWGFLVPTIWGFSGRWLPVFLGMAEPRQRLLKAALTANSLGVVAIFLNAPRAMALLLLAGAGLAVAALHLVEPPLQPAKTNGVHPSYPVFIRIAYLWMVVAALLGVWAAWSPTPEAGLWGASRHALTVGMVALMVFNIGQRVLPAFCGMRLLFSRRLMLCSSMLLTVGCFLRVSSEMTAYSGLWRGAWQVLPWSAWIEFLAIGLFSFNLIATLLSTPPAARKAA